MILLSSLVNEPSSQKEGTILYYWLRRQYRRGDVQVYIVVYHCNEILAKYRIAIRKAADALEIIPNYIELFCPKCQAFIPSDECEYDFGLEEK